MYSLGTRQIDYIREYATRYNTVEIDSTFYGTPRQSTVDGWRERTPEAFLFAAKAPQLITHQKFLENCEKDLAEFLKVMEKLGPRLGPVVFQFPYYSKKYNVREDDFLARLKPFVKALPKDDGHQFVIEVRNKAWLRAPLCELLTEHGIALALIDHPWMHTCNQLMKIDGIFTGPFAYIRLLGDRYAIEKITTTWGEHVIDRKPDLARWAPVMKSILSQRLNVFGYINSHYSGYAPGDVDTLYELLGEGK
ncbi:MAG: DUF72 domain-containing protein [Candidatus Hydrogenedentes bacterium]|nr:DUF72 domain-containing protein [Candidatus Hydrogenedentota bacterium]